MNETYITAKWIEPEGEIDVEKRQPACWLKKEFVLDKELINKVKGDEKQLAEIAITSHGCYEAYLNGRRIGDFIFAPGTGDYEALLPVQTYDVSEFLQEGSNTIEVLLGDGWYRSACGVAGKRNLFGDHIGLLLWLSVDEQIIVKTDETWEASTSQALLSTDMCQGEIYDARGENMPVDWHPVYEKEYDFSNLVFKDYLPIQEMERFQGQLIITPNGETVIDFGQNVAGYVEFCLEATEGQSITLTHGETLDKEGNFTIANFQPGDRHKEGGIFQKISYTAKEGKNIYKPHFCIFGFRYALVETDIDLTDVTFTAIAVYSKMKQTATFNCSNAQVNKLFENTLWSIKGNFCDVPTDCPHRERAGWTGDAGIFAKTGLYMMDCEKVFEKWLEACRINQYPNGMIRNIAPKNNEESFFGKMLAGSVGWGDACIIVPYEIYKKTNDKKILEDNYQMMVKWISYLEKRARKNGLKGFFDRNPYKNYTITNGLDYGEWCEPGMESSSMGVDRNGQSGVATAYLSYSAGLLGEIASILGKDKDAQKYKILREKAKIAYQQKWIPEGKVTSDRQKDYVRPLWMNLAKEEDRAKLADDLNELVIANNYHLNTGFLSTPHLCPVLADAGYVETAYRILLQDTQPGWLYQIKQGATTVWETWDGSASQNHYSYGAICGWLIEGVGGIQYENDTITLRPQPCKLLEFAEACYDSPVGRITSEWKVTEEGFTYTFEIPKGQKAILLLPDGSKRELSEGISKF